MKYWNKIYDEILAYYFWEPQHLGKVKNPESKITNYVGLIEHSKKLEVSLNHQLSLFFSLAPNDFILKFFNKTFTKQFDESFTFDITDIGDFVVGLKDFSQPDFWFVGEKNIVAVEMKLEAKTTLVQYIKYLLLNILYQEKAGTKKEFHLLYLTKNGLESLWDKKDLSFSTLIPHVEQLDFKTIKHKGSVDLAQYKNKVLELMKTTEQLVSSTNYSELGELLMTELNNTGNEVFKKLIMGTLDELTERNL